MITFINLNVGSGIEYVGEEFIKFTREVYKDINIISNQNPPYLLYKELMEFKPSIIILNEYYSRALEAVAYYKLSFPKTKIIFINHSSKIPLDNDIEKKDQYIGIRGIYKDIDYHIGLNGEGKDNPNIIDFGYMPVNPDVYNITTKWENRVKKFIILGNINDQKISKKFVERNSLHIDCYGINNGDYKEFNNNPQLQFISHLNQYKVPEILNEYKYAIFPFGGKEIFSISILQAALCGTIPIILNDSGKPWSEWASGIIFESNNIDVFVENLKHINKNNPDMSRLSEHISSVAKNKYNYQNIKIKYQDILKSILNNK